MWRSQIVFVIESTRTGLTHYYNPRNRPTALDVAVCLRALGYSMQPKFRSTLRPSRIGGRVGFHLVVHRHSLTRPSVSYLVGLRARGSGISSHLRSFVSHVVLSFNLCFPCDSIWVNLPLSLFDCHSLAVINHVLYNLSNSFFPCHIIRYTHFTTAERSSVLQHHWKPPNQHNRGCPTITFAAALWRKPSGQLFFSCIRSTRATSYAWTASVQDQWKIPTRHSACSTATAVPRWLSYTAGFALGKSQLT